MSNLNPPLSRADARAAVQAIEAAIAAGGIWPPDPAARGNAALTMAASATGINRNTLTHRLAVAWVMYGMAPNGIEPPNAAAALQARADRAAARRGERGFAPVLPGYEIAHTTTTTDKTGAVVRQTVSQRPERGEVFAVPAGHRTKGVSALVDPEGRTIAKWVKTDAKGDRLESLFKAIQRHAKRYARPLPEIAEPVADGDLLTLYPVADHHLGLYAWAREAGADYDLTIASRLLRETLPRLVRASPPSGTAVLLGLGDFFHADNSKNATPASGHVLDVDSRFAKVLETGCDLWVDLVSLALERHGRVMVRVLPGNHDPHAYLTIALYLRAVFKKNPRVEIDTDPSLFWFHQFGKVMLGATHGHAAKVEDLPGIMAAQRPKMWGETTHRFAFGAHLHHGRTGRDINGVRWETVPTIAAKDSYAAGNGWTAMREMLAYTYNRERGRTACVMANVA